MPKASPAARLEALNNSIRPMDEIDTKLKILLYGVSGVGKTVEAFVLAQMTRPEDKKILYVDTGEGWISVLNHDPKYRQNVVRMAFEGLSQIETIVDVIKANVKGYENFSTIVFDEFSTTAKKDLHSVMDATLDDDDKMSPPEFKQFNITTRRMEGVYFKLLELKETHHLIFIAHAREDENKKTGIRVTGPSFMDKFGATVRENVHVVAHMTADIKGAASDAPRYEYVLQVHPSKQVIAKSRIGGLNVKVPLDAFNTRIEKWLADGQGNLIPAETPEELATEREISGDFEEQAFSGYEVNDN
jgi:hypothetical protein